MIVDVVYNCNYDCTYCYLQHYVNTPYLTVYANVAPLFDELAAVLQARAPQLVRLGSGEFSDSLSLDPLTGFSRLLIPFLRQFPNVLFEFKTKSGLVEQRGIGINGVNDPSELGVDHADCVAPIWRAPVL